MTLMPASVRSVDERGGEGGGAAAPRTIGDLIAAGRGLTATCEVCLHSARLDLKDLALRYGADHSCEASALRPKLQCSVCKSTEAVLQETAARRDRALPATLKISA